MTVTTNTSRTATAPQTEEEALAQIIALAEQFNISIRAFDSDYIRRMISDVVGTLESVNGLEIVSAFESLGISEDALHDRVVAGVKASPGWASVMSPNGWSWDFDEDPARDRVEGWIEDAVAAQIAGVLPAED